MYFVFRQVRIVRRHELAESGHEIEENQDHARDLRQLMLPELPPHQPPLRSHEYPRPGFLTGWLALPVTTKARESVLPELSEYIPSTTSAEADFQNVSYLCGSVAIL